jgi:putative endonuclease
MQSSLNFRKIGYEKESLVVDYLKHLGYKILERNWHYSNRGEIDIIAIDPNRFNSQYLIFIEVKYRKASLDIALRSLSKNKQMRLKKLALYYCKEANINALDEQISFDFISLDDSQIEHIKDIFTYSF